MDFKDGSSLPESFESGTKVTFTCIPGYTGVGRPWIICNGSTWSQLVLKCEREYQHFTFSDRHTDPRPRFSTPNQICMDIYFFLFHSSFFLFKAKSCASPGELNNGQIDFSEGIDFGAQITITCNEGLVINTNNVCAHTNTFRQIT